MLKPGLRRFLGLATNQPPVDPARFGDPLAVKTEWTPASKGGSSFRTHKLIGIDSSRVEFRASAAAKVFYTMFILVGIVFVVVYVVSHKPTSVYFIEAIMPVFIGGIFVLLGGIMLYTGTSPIVFDKGIGYFWKGRKSPQDVVEVSSLKKCAALEQIHAIQLLSEFVRTSKSAYYSYELNIVLEDSRRLTVIDHGNLARLREDAKNLSEFLGKPIWDAIDRQT